MLTKANINKTNVKSSADSCEKNEDLHPLFGWLAGSLAGWLAALFLVIVTTSNTSYDVC